MNNVIPMQILHTLRNLIQNIRYRILSKKSLPSFTNRNFSQSTPVHILHKHVHRIFMKNRIRNFKDIRMIQTFHQRQLIT